MSINASLFPVHSGTAKTYEHLGSGFSFRAVGDGALEPVVVDKFSSLDNIAENLQDRRLRRFVQAESAFTKPENAVADEKTGQAKLQEALASTLGEGWTVDAFYSSANGTASRTVVKYQGLGGASQTVDIEHRGAPKVTLGAKVSHNGWEVNQSIDANLLDGEIHADQPIEHVYLTKY
jgi:hypothetical protein